MFTNDYIIREIENLARFLAKTIFVKKDDSEGLFDEFGNITGSGLLYHRLKTLMLETKINEAEDLLFEEFERNPNEANLDVALKFYSDLAKLNDKVLERAGFSKQEIAEGLKAIKDIYLKGEL